MKKVFSALVLIIATTNFGKAQEQKFGVIGGANYSKIIGDFSEIYNSQRRLAYHIGFFLDFKLSDKLLFKPQLLYSLQGDYQYDEGTWPNIDGTISTYIFDVNSRYEFISLPFEFRYAVKNKFSIVLGPQIQYNLQVGYNGETIIDGVKEKAKESYDFDPKLDYGVILGLSHKLSSRLFVDFKYFHGISNSNRKERVIRSSEFKTYNSVLQLSVGYALF